MNSIENISCKITGAGGGGCMIAFARSSVELSQALSLFKDTVRWYNCSSKKNTR